MSLNKYLSTSTIHESKFYHNRNISKKKVSNYTFKFNDQSIINLLREFFWKQQFEEVKIKFTHPKMQMKRALLLRVMQPQLWAESSRTIYCMCAFAHFTIEVVLFSSARHMKRFLLKPWELFMSSKDNWWCLERFENK